MKKRIIPSLVLTLIVAISAVIMPVSAVADEAEYSLTVQFTTKEKGVIPGSEFKLYLAMDMDGVLTDDFAGYDVTVGDIYDSEDLGALADTLAAYSDRDDIQPLQTVETNDAGLARFDGLDEGIYLAVGSSVTIDNVTYTPKPCIVRVPYLQAEVGLVTNVVATVKYDRFEIPDENIERSVKKVWADNDYKDRPEEITVQLLKDGEIFDEVTLTEDKNWQHTWTELDPNAEWKVTEADVPEDYSVQIVLDETTFVVTNTFEGDVGDSVNSTPTDTDSDTDKNNGTSEDDKTTGTVTTDTKLPQTGQLWWPVPILFVSGAVIMLIGIVVSRLSNDEKEA